MLFKIKNGLVPHYLKNLLPISKPQQDRYILRRNDAEKTIKFRLKWYETSFFHSTLKLWNKLSDSDKLSNTLPEFKIKIIRCPILTESFDHYPKSHLFSHCSGYYGRILNQIRYGISPLKFHLFTYCISDNPMCPNCHDCTETTRHFFLECTSLTDYRIKLFGKIEVLFSDYVDVLPVDTEQMLTLFLNGTNLNGNLNYLIYVAVVSFMRETKRFIKSDKV